MGGRKRIRKKLIEVELPLAEIGEASVREKGATHGHPGTLHRYWARRPLAACRAIVYATFVDDPSAVPEEFPTVEDQKRERERLIEILKRILKWGAVDERNAAARRALDDARKEIARSIARCRDETPPESPEQVTEYLRSYSDQLVVLDPFAGGGSIPLEAARMGLRAAASDLNPLAVLLSKAMLEIPSRFAEGRTSVIQATGDQVKQATTDPDAPTTVEGQRDLANHVRFYGKRVRDIAESRIRRFYPQVLDREGTPRTVVAYLYARNYECSNSTCGIRAPLLKTFKLSDKAGNKHWLKPSIVEETGSVEFDVVVDDVDVPSNGTVRRTHAICVSCGTSTKLDTIAAQGRDGRLGKQMTAIVLQGDSGLAFVRATSDQVDIAMEAQATWAPAGKIPEVALGFRIRNYGFNEWKDLFTHRQLSALTIFSDTVNEVSERMLSQGMDAEYVAAVRTFLSLAVGRSVDAWNKFAIWVNSGDKVAGVYVRPTFSMVWDFAEVNPFSQRTQNWKAQIEWIAKVIERLPVMTIQSSSEQADAAADNPNPRKGIFITDPPYYDNIGYADLSDMFYVWHRSILRDTYPDLFGGILTPKSLEAVKNPRFKQPGRWFEERIALALRNVRRNCNPCYPSSIIYAYLDQETKNGDSKSTGWEKFLAGLVDAGLQVVATWPIKTERPTRTRAQDSNALSSSVLLVVRPRRLDAGTGQADVFKRKLRERIHSALAEFEQSMVAPADIAQAAIGPGMEVFSKWDRVETPGGEQVTVAKALAWTNQAIREYYRESRGEFDGRANWCVDWMYQHGFREGEFGTATLMTRAMNFSVADLHNQGLVSSARGKVNLVHWTQFATAPRGRRSSNALSMWEVLMRIAYHFSGSHGDGVNGAGSVLHETRSNRSAVAQLARVVFEYFNGENDPTSSRVFNDVVSSWSKIEAEADRLDSSEQGTLG